MTDEDSPDWALAIRYMEGAIKRGSPVAETAASPFCERLQKAVRNRSGFDDLVRHRIREKMDPPPVQLDVLDEILPD